MGDKFLQLMNDALTMLKPDGFYFSPFIALAQDLYYHFYRDVREEILS